MQPPSEKHEQVGSPAGDQDHFLSLIETHHRLLLKVCWAYTKTDHDRDDLFQEIVGRLWAAFGKYDRNRKFSTWMYRVALNVAIDFHRRQSRRWRQSQSLDDAQEPQLVEDSPKQDLIDDLHEMLERLDEADRAIVLLTLEGNSYREIAEVMGISQSNVGTRLSRLKQTLRDFAHASE